MQQIFNNLDDLIQKGIYLRPCKSNDVDYILNLSKETMHNVVQATWPEPSKQDAYFKALEFNEKNTYIIHDKEQNLGRISLDIDENNIYINGIHLSRSGQGKGIGSFLLNTVVKQAKKDNKSVSLRVLKTNPAANLYQKLGFKIQEETPERYKMKIGA